MEKLMNKYFAKIVIAALFLISSAAVFGQGCGEGANVFSYQGRSVYLPVIVNGKKKYVKVKRAVTGERVLNIPEPLPIEFQFTFKPQKVRVEKRKVGDKYAGELIFEPSTTQTGDLYAIYHKADLNSDNSFSPGVFILPLSQPTDGAKARPRPFTFYYDFDGNLIGASPPGVTSSNPWEKEVRVRKLTSGLTMDVSDMEDGFYWFTLQGMSVINSQQNPDRCSKTTPPVLVEIRTIYDDPPPPDHKPTVEITSPITGDACQQKIITAVAKDDDNLPGSPYAPQTLRLTWEIRNKQSGAIVERRITPVGSPTNPVYTEKAETINLLPGDYTVKVTVTDGKYTASDDDKFDTTCSGAGIVYIQFDEPYQPLKDATRGIPFNYDPYREPNDWGIYRSRRGQCRSGKVRPDGEFLPFYNTGYATLPSSVEENKDKLDRIGNILKNDPEIMLYVLGYADFRNDLTYNKYLVDRRNGAVMKYLKDNYGVTEDRLVGGKAINNSNESAISRDEDPCSDGRMHDRRVELIYFKRNTVVTLPPYSRPLQE